VDDVILTTGDIDVVGKKSVILWARQFLRRIDDLRFELLETFQNADGSRVASRWRFRGRNNGVLGTAADRKPISVTGMAIWAVGPDGKLLHYWVERASWEMYQQLAA
jgi:SnoaL-like polyketide cyclase